MFDPLFASPIDAVARCRVYCTWLVHLYLLCIVLWHSEDVVQALPLGSDERWTRLWQRVDL